MTTALQELSAKTAGYFYKRESDDRWFRKDDSPKWVYDMVYDAHCDLFPDDYRYRFVVSALDAFSNYEDPQTAIGEIESDPYNSQLIDWLGSNVVRISYADENIIYQNWECSLDDWSVMDVIRAGQVSEKCDTYHSVLKHLNQQLDDDD